MMNRMCPRKIRLTFSSSVSLLEERREKREERREKREERGEKREEIIYSVWNVFHAWSFSGFLYTSPFFLSLLLFIPLSLSSLVSLSACRSPRLSLPPRTSITFNKIVVHLIFFPKVTQYFVTSVFPAQLLPESQM